MTGPVPAPNAPASTRLWDYITNFGDVQFPLGSTPMGPGGWTLNDLLVPFTDSRSDSRLLPETISINDVGRALGGLAPAEVTRRHYDAIAGVDSRTGEPVTGFSRLLDLFPAAGAEGGGAIAPAVERGSTTLGTFAGRRAATADQAMRARALEMEAAGGNPGRAGNIRQETGWFKDEAGDWKYEIGDQDSAIKLTEPNARQVYTGPYDPDEPPRWLADYKLGDVLEHPQLFEAYPWLRDVQVYKDTRMGPAEHGQFEGFGPDPATWGIRLGGDPTKRGFHHGTLMHEIQHGIQEYENFARGGSSSQFKSTVDNDLVHRLAAEAQDYSDAERLQLLKGDVAQFEAAYGRPPSDEGVRLSALPREDVEGMANHLLRKIENHTQLNSPHGQYLRLLGEVEARDVEARLNYPDWKRQAVPPYTSQKIPPDQYILQKWNIGGAAEAPQAAPGPTLLSKPGGTNAAVSSVLDLAPESRLARALDQGFTVDAYHGTKGDFDTFQPGGPGKPNPDAFIHVGDQEAANGAIMRAFQRDYWEDQARNSPDPTRRAEAQAQLEDYYTDARIMPLKVRAQNPLDMPDLGRWDSAQNFRNRAVDENYSFTSGRYSSTPKGWNPPPELFNEMTELAQKAGYDSAAWQQGFADILRRHGYDSVRYANTIEGQGGHSYMLLDPNQVRSRFAEFDPNKVDDSMILSGKAGPTNAIVSALANMPPAENARLTQIATTGPTYAKAMQYLREAGIDGDILDYGAGRGHGAKATGADSYEPYPPEGFEPTYGNSSDIPEKRYRGVLNLNVLNVLPPDLREGVVREIGRVLAPQGQAIISTRGRDVLNAKGMPGPEDMSLIIGEGDKARYQKGFKPGELVDYLTTTLGPDYAVEGLKLGQAGARVTRLRSQAGVPAIPLTRQPYPQDTAIGPPDDVQGDAARAAQQNWIVRHLTAGGA